ncbi:reverse transcriptase-like protein [Intrasporangium calvum]|uniref:Reverse transcriptase-like protein n=1 Tax=Intrasporangium calvum TaxID=53358 RepID=A0ABT5GL47_9MICO|nr:reverse transcriptase-like protein [Intrasporangium calvum]MDC5698778.1 reverse transcriptase-like protein [Intrasporangium calvum]
MTPGPSSAAARDLVVEADGGSRGNPGVAGYGALVRDGATGSVLVELAEPLGQASNNVAEYSGLLAGLRAAADLDPSARMHVRMDSKLVIEQMSGRWKVKHEDMRRLAGQVREVLREIEGAGGSVAFEWIPREQNKAADLLSNKAMDGQPIRRTSGPSDPDEVPELADAPDAPDDAAERQDLRLLLIQVPSSDAAIERIVRAVRPLTGRDARVIAAPEPLAQETGRAVAEAVDGDLEVSADWTADPGRAGSEPTDAASSAAYGRLRRSGGTVVVVTTRRGIVTVLAEVLGLVGERFWSLATAPGSLTGVEVWADGSASIAFTNRTDHLA